MKKLVIGVCGLMLAAAVPAQAPGGGNQAERRHWEVVREAALEEVLPAGFLHAQIAENPALEEKLHQALLARRLCEFYRSSRFPKEYFGRQFRSAIASHPDAGAMKALFLKEHPDAAAGWAAASANDAPPSGVLLESFQKFYLRHRGDWFRARQAMRAELYFEIGGRALDHFNQVPLSGVTLTLIRQQRFLAGKANSNREGAFRFKVPFTFVDLPLMVRGERPGFVTAEGPGGFPLHRHEETSWYNFFDTIPLLTDHCLLRGTVVDAGTRAPVPGVRVSIIQKEVQEFDVPEVGGVLVKEMSEPRISGGIRTVETDSRGGFLTSTFSGNVTLRFEKDGYPPVTRGITLRGHDAAPRWFEISRSYIPVEIAVEDPDGRPIPFARVHEGKETCVADHDGRFVTAVPPGESRTFTVQHFGMDAETVVAAGGEPLKRNVALRFSTVRGETVVRGDDGNLLEGAWVLSYPQRDLVQTDSAGKAAVTLMPAAGASLIAGKSGYVPHVESVNLFPYWAYAHPVIGIPDIVLFSEDSASPVLEAPLDGSYVARPGEFPVRLRLTPMWNVAWQNVVVSAAGAQKTAKAGVPLTQIPMHFASGPQELSVQADYLIGDKRKTFHVKSSFHAGLPPGMRSMEAASGESGNLAVTLTLDAQAFPARVLAGLRILENGEEALDYTTSRDGNAVTLRATASAAASHIHVRYEDASGKPVHVIW